MIIDIIAIGDPYSSQQPKTEHEFQRKAPTETDTKLIKRMLC